MSQRHSDRRLSCRIAALVLALAALTALPGFAAAPTVLGEIGSTASVALAAVPGGGYLLVWQDLQSLELRARRISAAGLPGRVQKLADFESLDSTLSAAIDPSGALAVLWTEPAGADQVGVGGAFFDPQGRLVRQVSYPDPLPDPGQVIIGFGAQVAAHPAGGFVVGFNFGIQEDPLGDPLRPSDTDVYVMRLDAGGQKIGEAVRVHQDTAGFQRLTGIGVSASGLVVGWTSRPAQGTPDDLRVRLLTLGLAPATGEIQVAEAPPSGIQGSTLAVGPDGRFVLVWEEVENDSFLRLRMRAFTPEGTPIGDKQAVAPTEARRQGSPQAAVTREGIVWVSWIETPNDEILARSFDLNGQPLGGVQEIATVPGAVRFLTGGAGGALLAWREGFEGSLLRGQVLGPAGQAGPPPADHALESPELPGFRVWVRITPSGGTSVWGTRVEPCLAEALCVAGALHDRAEVIVRVVGPKPNGFLWPTIVKLSTSQAEVWLEQTASGDIQFYVLPAVSPGGESLPGLFDRDGFEP